jgi:hypothetical protein
VVIESNLDLLDVSVRVEISGVRGARLEGGAVVGTSGSITGPVKFDVNARLEEKERRSGKIVVFFVLSVGTKPSIVKFELEGYATLTGKDEALGKMLEVDPKTGVPFVFHRVYQHSFMAIYLMATLMGTIYPPPDLLFSGEHHAGTGLDATKPENEEVHSAQQVTSNSEGQKQ